MWKVGVKRLKHDGENMGLMGILKIKKKKNEGLEMEVMYDNGHGGC